MPYRDLHNQNSLRLNVTSARKRKCGITSNGRMEEREASVSKLNVHVDNNRKSKGDI